MIWIYLSDKYEQRIEIALGYKNFSEEDYKNLFEYKDKSMQQKDPETIDKNLNRILLINEDWEQNRN